MPARNPSNPDVDGCFEVTLARGLNMSRKRLPVQTAISKHKRRFFSLAEHKRYELAAALQWEYRRRSSWVNEDERALQILNDKYSDAQHFVTPVHRVPVEILMEIFHIVFDEHPSPIGLMLVCHCWYDVIQAMSGLQVPVELCTWTAPDIVTRTASGMGRRLLNITIDTDQDHDLEVPSIERYSAFAIAAESASQWRSLTVHSLPTGQQLGDPTLHKILSMDIPPMSQLEELKITSEVDPSPLVDRLLQIIGATAMEYLMIIETRSLYAIRSLLQASPSHTFHSLTTLKAVLPKLSEQIDILARSSKLEVLEATNLLLPSYQNDSPLPFSQTLRRLYLKSGTIGWMAGREFPLLTVCTIITPCEPLLALDVFLPACTEFHFHHRSTALFGRFHIPIVSSLVVNSNHWTPLQGSQGLVDMCMAGLGTVMQPRVLHLAMLCNGSVLRTVLQELPALEELILELPRPSALGRGFFTSLLAKPATIPYGTIESKWFEWAKKQRDWHVAICPSLRVFNLYYQRWVRPSEQFGWIAPLLALGWTRRKTATPLQASCVHLKTDEGTWKRVELVPVESQCLIDLDIPQLKHLTEQTPEFIFQAYLTGAALSVIEGPLTYNMMHSPNLTEAVFGTSLNRIRVLVLHKDVLANHTLNILHCFHRLEDLSLTALGSSLYPDDVDLPLLQTLQRLNIVGGCVKWLDGHTFVQLTSFSVEFMQPSWCDSFPNGVDMPACTHISLFSHTLEFLPVIHTAFALPLATEWNLHDLRSYTAKAGRLSVIDALSQIQARVLRFSISTQFEHLVMVIQLKYELEELSVEVDMTDIRVVNKFLISLTEVTVGDSLTKTTNASFDTHTIRTRAIATAHLSDGPEMPICPNLKVLELKFWSATSDQRGEIRQWCVQMMESRRRVGCLLDRCRIWWHGNDRSNDPSLVLSTSNEGIITDE